MLQFEFILPLLPWLLILLAWMVIIALASYFNLEKYNIEVGPFMLFARTEKFNNLLNRIGRWHPRAWRYIWSGFIGVAFFFSLFGFYSLSSNVWEFVKEITGQAASPGPVAPLIPGITMSFEFFLMILIPLIVSIIVHELAHGIAARADQIPVKSSGLFFFIIFFGAFVEPDEEYVKTKSARSQRARLYASGSGANLTLALLVIVFATLIVVPVPSGVYIQGIESGSSADGILTSGMIITGMNGTSIHSVLDLQAFMADAQPGDLIIVTVFGETQIPLNIGSRPYNESIAYIGIFIQDYFPLHYPFSLLGSVETIRFQESLFWFFTITLSLGIINLLPIPPLDGDRLWKELIDKTISMERKSGKVLLWFLRIAALSILAINIIFTIIMPGLLGIFFR